MEPNNVSFENRDEVYLKLYGAEATSSDCKFLLGDVVRIPLKKNLFDKGYKISWTKELYKVVRVRNDGSVCYYQLDNLNGERLNRAYYDQQLNLVIRNEIPPVDK